jgi:hypothetical protein
MRGFLSGGAAPRVPRTYSGSLAIGKSNESEGELPPMLDLGLYLSGQAHQASSAGQRTGLSVRGASRPLHTCRPSLVS